MANCTKEKALEVTTKYLDREWEKIKQIEFFNTIHCIYCKYYCYYS